MVDDPGLRISSRISFLGNLEIAGDNDFTLVIVTSFTSFGDLGRVVGITESATKGIIGVRVEQT